MIDEMIKYWLDYYYNKKPYLNNNWIVNNEKVENLDL